MVVLSKVFHFLSKKDTLENLTSLFFSFHVFCLFFLPQPQLCVDIIIFLENLLWVEHGISFLQMKKLFGKKTLRSTNLEALNADQTFVNTVGS